MAEWRNDPRAEENIQLIIMIIEDGTYVMANALGEDNNPYAYVIQALRKTLKLCLTSPKGETSCLISFMGYISVFMFSCLCRRSYCTLPL